MRGFVWIFVSAVLGTGALAGLAVWLIYFPPIGDSYRRIVTDDPLVALTYDDGPNPPHTDQLLALFRRHTVKATFFMMGRHAEFHPDVVRRVVAAGHQVGNHSYDDAILTFRSAAFVRDQIHRTDVILRQLGVTGRIDFRAPHVAPFLTVSWILSEEGRRHIGANVVPQDWSTDDADTIAQRVLDRISPGSIVMFHDGLDSRDGADRAATVRATEKVILALREKGYRFVTVEELLAYAQ